MRPLGWKQILITEDMDEDKLNSVLDKNLEDSNGFYSEVREYISEKQKFVLPKVDKNKVAKIHEGVDKKKKKNKKK
jgi:hypothetical protein